MPTQGVMNRQRVGEALIAAARTHAHDVGERIRLTPPNRRVASAASGKEG